MKTNYVPAIVMLLAGLVDCIISIYYKIDLYMFTKRLLLVLIIFYILGYIIKIILDINFPIESSDNDDEPQKTEEDSESVENVEAQMDADAASAQNEEINEDESEN